MNIVDTKQDLFDAVDKTVAVAEKALAGWREATDKIEALNDLIARLEPMMDRWGLVVNLFPEVADAVNEIYNKEKNTNV